MTRFAPYDTLAEAIASLNTGLDAGARPEDREVVVGYLAVLAPLLADAALGIDVLPRLREVERLLGNSRLTDEASFADGLAKWRQFKSEYEHDTLSAMTVNERLSAMGLFKAFDRARAEGDKEAVAAILRSVHVDEASIEMIVRR